METSWAVGVAPGVGVATLFVLHDDNRFGAFELVLGQAKRGLSTPAVRTKENDYDGLFLDIDDHNQDNTGFVWDALEYMIRNGSPQTFILYSRDRNAGTKYGAVPEPETPIDPKTGRRQLVMPGHNGKWTSSRLHVENPGDFWAAKRKYYSGKSL